MALIKWGYEEEEEQKDPFAIPSLSPVQSVQESWQPASATDNDQQDSEQGSYLMSAEKAQFDQEQAQRREQEEAARAQAEAARVAAESENARRAQAANELAAQQTQQEKKPATKYTQPKKKDEGIWGLIKGIGAGVQQGLASVGDVAVQGGGMVDYASQRLQGVDDATASRNVMESTNRTRNLIHSGKDITGRNFTGTRDVEEQASRIANGTGTLQDLIAVGGKGLQTGIDATMFLNPARMAAGAIPLRGASTATSTMGRLASNPAVQYAARDAAFFGGAQGAATTAQQYGQNGDIEEALKAGATDAAIGGVLQGGLDLGGHMTRQGYETLLPVANKTINSLRQPKEFRIGDEVVELTEQPSTAEVPLTPVEPPTQDSNISFENQIENAPLGQPSDLLQNAELTPVRDTELAPQTPEMTPVADGVAQTPVEPVPAQSPVDEVDVTNVTPEPIPAPQAPLENVQPVADGTVQAGAPVPATNPNMPTIRAEEVRALQDARAGKSQADEAQINQQLNEMEAPRIDDGELPDGMDTPEAPTKQVNPDKQNRKDFANVFTRSTDSNSDMDARLRSATGMTQDKGSDVAQILEDGGVTGKQAERIQSLFDRAAEIAENNKATQKQYRKDFIKEGREAIDDAPARQRNRETEEAAYVRSQLNSELKKLERKGDWGEKLTQGFENVISGKNSNQLIGAPIERGLTAEIIGNAMNTVKNPIKQIRGATMHGIPGKSAVKRLIRDLKTPPKTMTEGYKYLIGNTYRAAMTPAQALADSRKGAFRTELTKYAYKGKIGEELSSKDAEKVSRMAGNDMEALVNMGAGVDNGTINVLAYRKALKQWKQFVESGSEADYGKFIDTVDRQTSIVDKLAQGFSTEGKNRAQRAGLTLVNTLLPYMRNAVNMSTKGVVLDLNPFTLSLVDGIRKDQRGFMSNLALGIKNKTVDYAVLAALGSVLTYNDGTDPDTVDQPRGVSIHLGGDEYFAIRGTPLELPLGALMVAKQLAQDGAEGKFKDAGYYGGMITPSIPYVDYMTSHGNVIDSLEKMGTEEGDDGYAAKNFLISNAKSLTPFSNNNVEASLSRFGENESLTAKTVYASKDAPDGEGGTKKVADMPQWYKNSLANNNLGKVLPFVPDRSELKDSRDAAGRVRTVDNQGSWVRKKINDKDTATHNGTVTDLVKYAREAKLGNGTQEMFNTYDTGKNNNFKSVQDSITFLDTKDGKPDNTKKLEQNAKLGDLAGQIRNGFYGDTGDELLTLDGKNLYSDVSIPNADGTKNSRLPLNMQTIKNAIAATDLPEAERNRMYEISQANQALYSKVESKEWTYAQYKAAKAESEQEYVSILSDSKNYKKMVGLMDELDKNNFFKEGGIGSTKSGQTYLWNSLNALLGSKGATPAANYPKDTKGFTPWGKRGGGGGSGRGKAGAKSDGAAGIKWTPAGKRQMASTQTAKYTPVNIKVKLGNAVKKDKSQNYSDRTF